MTVPAADEFAEIALRLREIEAERAAEREAARKRAESDAPHPWLIEGG